MSRVIELIEDVLCDVSLDGQQGQRGKQGRDGVDGQDGQSTMLPEGLEFTTTNTPCDDNGQVTISPLNNASINVNPRSSGWLGMMPSDMESRGCRGRYSVDWQWNPIGILMLTMIAAGSYQGLLGGYQNSIGELSMGSTIMGSWEVDLTGIGLGSISAASTDSTLNDQGTMLSSTDISMVGSTSIASTHSNIDNSITLAATDSNIDGNSMALGGVGLISPNDNSVNMGSYNTDASDDTCILQGDVMLSVGGGDDETTRRDHLTVYENGDVRVAANLVVNNQFDSQVTRPFVTVSGNGTDPTTPLFAASFINGYEIFAVPGIDVNSPGVISDVPNPDPDLINVIIRGFSYLSGSVSIDNDARTFRLPGNHSIPSDVNRKAVYVR